MNRQTLGEYGGGLCWHLLSQYSTVAPRSLPRRNLQMTRVLEFATFVRPPMDHIIRPSKSWVQFSRPRLLRQ